MCTFLIHYCLLIAISLALGACNPSTPGSEVLVTASPVIPAVSSTKTPTAEVQATTSATRISPTEVPTETSISTPTVELLALAGTPFPPLLASIGVTNASSVHQLARWGNWSVNQVATSPDGGNRGCGAISNR